MKKISVFLSYFFLFIPFMLHAEIVNIAVRWDGKACRENCNMQLERGFKRMPGAVGLDVDYKNGFATMRWMPLSRFQFQNIALVLRPPGVQALDVTMTVRGTVTKTGNRVTLTSIGDETAFILVPKPPENIKTKPNLNNYSATGLDPNLLQVLDNSEKGYYVITVTGKLLSPEQSPPNYLGVESIVSDAPATNTPLSPKDRLKQWQVDRNNTSIPAKGAPPSNPPIPASPSKDGTPR
ncbi:MAG: hypothetical protein WC222_07540 [Parachlamydiales bacterium]|jgi:hypothetical protein